jgi:hypothetical protein
VCVCVCVCDDMKSNQTNITPLLYIIYLSFVKKKIIINK